MPGLTTRQAKGSKLTIQEMDENLIYLDNKVPYKVYTALLTQTGTNPPVAIVLENTLGGELVWSRNNDGEYTATLAGAFPDQNKFFTLNVVTAVYTANSNISIYWNNSNSFALNTATGNGFSSPLTPADDILYEYPIEIRAYN